MLLDYASPPTPVRRIGLAVLAALFALACGAVTVWCVIHTLYVYAEFTELRGAICGNYIDEVVSRCGVLPETTIPIGILSSGFGFVAAIKSIRWFNSALGLRSPREA